MAQSGPSALDPLAGLPTGPSVNAPCGSKEWATPAEASCYRTTPRYAETMAYVRRVAAAAPRQVKVVTFGKTGQGRDLVAVIVSKDGQFSPAALHSADRPIVLVQNSIHAGEMDGKDSSLALLRDMVITKTQAKLLDRAVVIFIPIYNADGHERFGPYNRINQNGPAEMGWRVNAENQNLNRDYVKADAPETRAWLKLWNEWLPDFFVDDHVTDGADYQYDVTYNVSQGPDSHPEQVEWVTGKLKPYLEKSVTDAGHVIGPTIFLADENDPSKGLEAFTSSPRFSDGYVILQNRIGMLVEMHMLKDYKTRVTGNYEVLRALLEAVNRDADTLVKINRDADEARIAAGRNYDPSAIFPLVVDGSKETAPFLYRGFKYRRYQSDVSGQMAIEYSREPENVEVPRQARLEITRSVNPPAAYIVPRQWTHIIEVLEAHGLALRRTAADWNGEVETYRCSNMKWQPRSFEGHHVMFAPGLFTNGTAESGECRLVKEKMDFPTGSVVVPLDQRAAAVAIHWLEPMGPDSAMSWGFFDAIFEQKEYGEPYVLEKLAREMMAKDPQLRAEFEQRVAADKQFAADPDARLNWFYMRSPWWDNELGLYPVGRLLSLEGIPLEK